MLRGYIFTAQTNGSLKQDSAIPYYITVFKASLKLNGCFKGSKDRRPKFCSAITIVYKSHKSNLHHVSPLRLQLISLETNRKNFFLEVTGSIGFSEKISALLGPPKVNLPIRIFLLYQCITALDQHQKKEHIYACGRTVNCFLSYRDRGMPLILQHMAQNQSLLLLHFHHVRMLILGCTLYINLIKYMRNKFCVLVNSGFFFIWVFFPKQQTFNHKLIICTKKALKVFYRVKGKQEKVVNSCMYAVLKLPWKIKVKGIIFYKSFINIMIPS